MASTFRVVDKRVPQEERKVAYSKINLMDGCSGDDPSQLSNEERVGVIIGNVRKFLANPPGEEITSLNLSGIEGLKGTNFPPNGKKKLILFVTYWYPKLTDLKVDYFDNFLSTEESYVNKLLSAPFLQRFLCYRISTSEEMMDADKLQTLFPQRLFNLPHVSVRRLDLKGDVLTQFFKRLAANPMSFEIKSTRLDMDFLFQEITKFISLTAANDYLDISVDLDGWTSAKRKRLGNFGDLVDAIVDSSATIRLTTFTDSMHKRAKEILTQEDACKLFECVEGAYSLSPSDLRGEFPNLKHLEVFREEDEGGNFIFPEGLQRLELWNGFPKQLVSSLTYLRVCSYRATFPKLLLSLMSLNGCQLLTTLQLHWVIKGDVASSAEISAFCLKELEKRKLFRNLTSLEFSVHMNFEESGAKVTKVPRRSEIAKTEAVVKILLNALKIPELSLTHLELNCWGCPSGCGGMLSRDTLTRMIEGRVAESLVSLEIGESASSTLEEDARPVLETLKEKVAENAWKLAEEEEEEDEESERSDSE